MKTPKYRFWNKQLKVLVPWEDIGVAIQGVPFCRTHGTNPPHFHLNDLFTKLSFEGEFNEWTGMLDKLGREIYVNDIVTFTYSTRVGLVQDIGVMGFNEKVGQFGVTDMTELDVPEYDVSAELPEIVGNIYEHANLLQNKQKLIAGK